MKRKFKTLEETNQFLVENGFEKITPKRQELKKQLREEKLAKLLDDVAHIDFSFEVIIEDSGSYVAQIPKITMTPQTPIIIKKQE